ncbi:hypothetical protein BN961_01126 [Afipia felis]|uniref:Uncharacterized protein n=1 Tax=Afipia felis TaxID=1035 RepID=A0A090MJQ5_AFIFE|nr:hypothetical protein BN961_01126 [Afipia felis]
MTLEIAAIVQTRERICDCHFERVLHAVAQIMRIAAAADLGAGPRQQLVLVHWAQQIIVHADLKPAQQLRVVVGFGECQQRHAAGALQRANLAAKP